MAKFGPPGKRFPKKKYHIDSPEQLLSYEQLQHKKTTEVLFICDYE